MKVIGIDPSLTSTGYGVVEKVGGRIMYIESGVITTKATESIEERLHIIYTNVCTIIQNTKPQKMILEETFVNNNFQTSLKLGMVRGVMILASKICNLSLQEVSPTFVKKCITGNGRAEKEQVEFMVLKLISAIPKEHKFKKNDETDALAMAICGVI